MPPGDQTDPYAGLQDQLAKRKSHYLATITARDRSKNAATVRGYLLESGPSKQTFTREQKRAARDSAGANQAVWTDTPALRIPYIAADANRLGPDSIYGTIARLLVEGQQFSPPFPTAEELPDLSGPSPFPVILRTAEILQLCTGPQKSSGQEDLENRIWDQVKAAHDHKGNQLFNQDIIDNILDALEMGPPSDLSSDELAVPWLAEFKAGAPQAFGPILGLGKGQQIGTAAATQLFSSLAKILGGQTAVLFIETALGDGRTVPISTPTGLIGNENDDLTLADDVWSVFEFLFWLSGLPGKPLRQALIDLANWLLPAPPQPIETLSINPPPLHLQDLPGSAPIDHTNIFHEIWANRVQVPSGFLWPDYNVVDLYWWRAIVLPICIQHLFVLADTSDFHTVALIRFASLFQVYNPDPTKRDVRVPAWVATDVQLALLGFKYWLDEAPATGNDGGEMTFWSENHQIQFAASEYLAGTLFPDQTFNYDPQNPKSASDRISRGQQRVRAWLDHRLRFGFSEWNAPGYYNEDLPALFALADFAPDLDIQVNTQMVLDTVVFDLARLCCRGSFGVTAGRAYWEHKCYGWEQSVGDLIEVLFGSRGDIMESASWSAVSFATSKYQVPDVLLAVAVDRAVVDRQTPFEDRIRVSMYPSEAKDNGVDPSQDDNLIFWWGNMNYFGTDTLDRTDQLSGSHDNLKLTPPFTILYKFIHLNDDEWHQVLYDTLEVGAGVVTAGASLGAAAVIAALPFPLDLLAIPVAPAGVVAGAGMIVEGVVHLLGDLVTLIGKGIHAIARFFGLAHDDPPKIPESALVEAFHKLLFAFNDGNVLQRANIYTYANGDAALSSLQNHLSGKMAFQKHPWEATLGTDACVWTTAPFRSPSTGSKAKAWLDFFADYLTLQTTEGFEALALTQVDAGEIFGHDGFTYWNGSMALPFVVQHRSAAIIAYQLNDLEERLSDPATHAWLPRAMFDEVSDLVDANDGSWVFARKDTFDPVSGARLGSGYVALFSARKLSWATSGPWVDKELIADGDANIFVCLVGNEAKFGSFDTFKQQTLNAYLHISGMGTFGQLECSFDIPGEDSPAGTTPRLELFYDDVKGRFAGQDLELNSFPRWDNPYANISWGSRNYTVTHAPTGLSLTHDLDHTVRTYNQQPDPSKLPQKLPRRLWDGTLTPARRFQTPPAQLPVGAQLRRELFQRGQS